MREYAGGLQDWEEAGQPLDGSSISTLDVVAPLEPPRRPNASHGLKARWGPSALLQSLANRPFNALLSLWLWLVLGFGAAYWLAGAVLATLLLEHGEPVPPTLGGLATAVYFSLVTATTVGFGDVVALGPLRALAALEAVAGFLLFGCLISKLITQRQELLIEEIHRIAFEDRLGRVRTNLHLVLSELQAISFEAIDLPANHSLERLLPRVESAAMVFTGELRTIHDLLYRPQDVPEESVLEALLANLAACLRELCDLLTHVPETARKSPNLAASLRASRRLASEICGNCVPREYAPELKLWMDRIQDLAHCLSPG